MLDVTQSGSSDAVKTLTVNSAIRHMCPFRHEVDNGRVKVELEIGGETIELHSLAAYFRSFADLEISHEALTDRIVADLASDGIVVVKVVTYWKTAGMKVRVESIRP